MKTKPRWAQCLACRGHVLSFKFRRVTQNNFNEWTEKLEKHNYKLKIGQQICQDCWEKFLSTRNLQQHEGLDGELWSPKKRTRAKLRSTKRERISKLSTDIGHVSALDMEDLYGNVLPELLLPNIKSLISGLVDGSLSISKNETTKGRKRKAFYSLHKRSMCQFQLVLISFFVLLLHRFCR